MSTVPVIAAQTAAIVAQVPYNTHGYKEGVVFSSFGLAGVEEIVPYIGTSGGWAAINDPDGTQVKMTATVQSIVLPSGPLYGFTKTATAGNAGLDANTTG